MNPLIPAATLFLALCIPSLTRTAQAEDSPGWDWTAASPESQGLVTSRMEGVWTNLQAHHTAIFLVIRNDKMVFERYAPGFNQTTNHYTASLAKALVGGMAVAVAIRDGRLALDNRASQYVPQWSDDPVKSKITIRQLGSHTSGLADAEEGGLPHDQLTGWKGDFWKRFPPPNDPFTISRDKAPVLFAPGAGFQYSNPGMAMLVRRLSGRRKRPSFARRREAIIGRSPGRMTTPCTRPMAMARGSNR